jgi:hypothetical protein
MIENIILHVENFKSYGSPGLVLDRFMPINVVIGRNNSGKSAILDAIEFACANKFPFPTEYHHKGLPTKVLITMPVGEMAARHVFPPTTQGGWIGGTHWDLGQHVATSQATLDFGADTQKTLVKIIPSISLNAYRLPHAPAGTTGTLDHPLFVENSKRLVEKLINPFSNMKVVRLSAERDIRPEPESTNPIQIDSNGMGLTNGISEILRSTKYNNALVEKRLLSVVNSIVSPDINITSIKTRKHHQFQSWEIFLEDAEKGTISLSNSGSGLKTIILTCALFEIIPTIGRFDISNTIYLLEELENNLHPALQRRLLSYVKQKIGQEGTLFLTTHSPVLIDMFDHDHDAQILHVQHENGESNVAKCKTYIEHRGVLDDLDVRASDILQSNGVIWVEGPSDRIYLNALIRLVSNDEIKEGKHYQCVFYGGRLLAHLTAAPPEEEFNDEVNLLLANRNAMIFIDSDRSSDADEINSTKIRISHEFENVGSKCYVTVGREIENLIPEASFCRIDERFIRAIGKFEEIEEYVSSFLGKEDARPYLKSKMYLARRFSDSVVLGDITAEPALFAMAEQVVAEIRRWNRM